MDDPNRQETEQDAIRAEALRRSRVRHLMRGRQDPSQTSSPSQSSTPATTESPSNDKPNMSE